MPTQAHIRSFRSASSLLRDGRIQQKLVVAPPRILTANGLAFSSEDGVAIRTITNLSTDALYWKIGGPIANIDDIHGILAGGSGTNDGLGTFFDFSNAWGPVYIYSAGEVRCVTFQAFAPEYLPV